MRIDGTALVAKGGVHVNDMDLVGASIRFDPTKRKVTSTGPVNISVGRAVKAKAKRKAKSRAATTSAWIA